MAKQPISKKEQRRRKKKRQRIIKKVLIIFGIIFAVGMLALGGYAMHAYMATRLPEATVINGVEVGNCTPATAVRRLGQNLNHIKVQSDDADVEIDACFTYDEAPIKDMVKKAAFNKDVKAELQSGKVTLNLKVTGGYKKTESVLREAKLSPEDKRAHDAYVDLKNMTIVEEEYGNELNYEQISKALAKYIEENGDKKAEKRKFKFSTKEYSIQPLVKSDNTALNDELIFDKEYIAGGLTIKYDDGSVVTMPVEELAKIIKYSKSGPKYYHSGAIEVARKYSKYKPSKYSIIISDKEYSLPNNGLIVTLNEESVAEALYQAAAGKHDAELTMDLQSNTRPYNNILVFNKKEQKAYMVGYGGSNPSNTYNCSLSNDMAKGIYKLEDEQTKLDKGIVIIEGGTTLHFKEDIEFAFGSLAGGYGDDQQGSYVAIINK